jgi:hypothetical protein
MSNFGRVLSELQSERKRAENELNRIDNAISALRGLAGGRGTGRNHTVKSFGTRQRRQLSAAARRRISQAQKARWAKFKAMRKAA